MKQLYTDSHEFPYFHRNVESVKFGQGNETTTEIHEFPSFRRNVGNMNFRQGNETTTEIHEFPYFCRNLENMNFRQEMTQLYRFLNFRISVEMLKT